MFDEMSPSADDIIREYEQSRGGEQKVMTLPAHSIKEPECCDKCGENWDPYNEIPIEIVDGEIVGVKGRFCYSCLDTAPAFCNVCWEWSAGNYDGECSNHDMWVECTECAAVWPLVRPFYWPGLPARGPSYASGGEPPESPEFECPACGSDEEPLQWGEKQ